MDYQYAQIVGNMNYLALVNMLSMQITPSVRKLVLDRLVEMNNEILGISKTSIPATHIPSPHLSYLNANEKIHPSFIYDSKQKVSEKSRKLQESLDSLETLETLETDNSLETFNSLHSPNSTESLEIDLDEILGPVKENKNTNISKNKNKNECPSIPDDLDIKLARIKQLHTKIITDKRRRRYERSIRSVKQ